jgi:hypothetical protein
MKKFLWGMVGAVSLLVACGNEVVVEEPGDTPGGSTTASSSSGTGSSSTSGGTTMECTPQDQAPTPMQPTCEDLSRLVLVDPVISGDTDGDGAVEPGEMATLTVIMKDVSGFGFNWYPGVEFSTKDTSIGVAADTWYYAILPCGEMPATATLKVAPDVAPGKTVTIRAQIAMLNTKCPDTFTIDVPVKVQ